MLAAVKNNGYALEHADDSLKKDKEIALIVAKFDVWIRFVDESLKNDPDILAIVNKNKWKNF